MWIFTGMAPGLNAQSACSESESTCMFMRTHARPHTQEEKVRSYIRDKHGSLINFLLCEGAKQWFSVTAGVNGCYYVDIIRDAK